MRHITVVALSLVLVALGGCGDSGEAGKGDPVKSSARSDKAPERIVVDHILIGVRSPNFAQGKRTAEEAKKFAYELMDKLKAGGDWDALKKANSEDPPPGGPYGLANHGVRPAGPPREFGRKDMVPAFGDVGFTLEVGELGMADFDARTSPFGFHLIKRVK